MPDGSVDMVLTFRNIHSWMGNDGARGDVQRDVRRAEAGRHPRRRGAPREERPSRRIRRRKSGYVRTDYAIALAKKAGFKLIGESEINANPKDTADHPNGVWSLPPTLRAATSTATSSSRSARATA